MKRFYAILVATVALLTGSNPFVAAADEIRVAAAWGVRPILLELGPQFEAETGHRLVVEFETNGGLVQQVSPAGYFDVVIANGPCIERLSRSNRLVAGSTADIASSVAAVAVRSGAPKPDVSTPEAFKRALLAARSISRPPFNATGSSGSHITLVAERLGIADDVNAKAVIGDRPRPPGQVVADGEAEVALHMLQELMAVPGLEIVGPFPRELQGSFMFSAALVLGGENDEAAKALIAFLRTPRASRVILSKGMSPAGSRRS
jgi:molybdate transport system substrate-binding protein